MPETKQISQKAHATTSPKITPERPTSPSEQAYRQLISRGRENLAAGDLNTAIDDDDELNLGIARNLTNLYTSARRSLRSPPSTGLGRPPDRKGSGRITAGNACHLVVTISAQSREG
jgi:hypothetical protein